MKVMEEVRKDLLYTLKTVVEGLLSCQVANIWNVYGGLDRVHTILEMIFKHEFKIYKENGDADLWKFIEAIYRLQPPSAILPSQDESPSDPAAHWLRQSLECHCLSERLSCLLLDTDHLSLHYREEAFLRQAQYAEATLICLRAIEQNQLSLLTEIPPSLFCVRHKVHRRCSSLPETLRLAPPPARMAPPPMSPSRRWGSTPCLQPCLPPLQGLPPLSRTLPSSPSIRPRQVTPPRRTAKRGVVTTTSESSGESCGRRRPKRKGFIEDGGGRSVLPMRTGYFPRPRRGQSLTSFLSSKIFAAGELDRENAHFSVSEAIIAAIEQVKWQVMVEEESDEEIRSLREKIRERRKAKEAEKRDWPVSDAAATDASPSPKTSASGGSTESLSTDVEATNEQAEKVSLGVEAKEQQTASAEGVALSLLSKFSERQLPKASDIVWLVSERDAPQELLPLPDSLSAVSPDEDMRCATELRGTDTWAPPRPQVIFTVHLPQRRQAVIATQKFRCAGCGMRVAEEYAGRLRYCEYLGRYFCTGCHNNDVSVIPGRILAKWDFNKYPVSRFSMELLEGMWGDPLFCPADVNPKLYKHIKLLNKTRHLRTILLHMKSFIVACRHATALKDEMDKDPDHMFLNPEIYSLDDFLMVKTSKLPERLSLLVTKGLKHVEKCQLCQGRGFMCESCRSLEVIFPWEVSRVVQCLKCGSCRHLACVAPDSPCPRCLRLARRKLIHDMDQSD